MHYSRIAGTGSYLPEKILHNHDLEKMLDTSDEWITARTGIRQRHIAADNETSSTMGTIASKRAIEAAGMDANEIDMIITATATPDEIFPSTATLIQQKLGIGSRPAFDISVACAGFNYGLGIADNFIRTGSFKTILVVGSEVMSRITDWSDRRTCILFADGAGAAIIQAADKPGIIGTHLHADGKYKDLLYAHNPIAVSGKEAPEPFMRMKGNEVFKVAVRKLGEAVIGILAENKFSKADIDWLVPHQANLRIIKAVAKKLELPMEKVVVTIDKQGNTSAASIPLALDEAIRDDRIQRGDTLLLESFGGGFAWGSALIRY